MRKVHEGDWEQKYYRAIDQVNSLHDRLREERERAERAEASLDAARKWLVLEQSAVEERDAALARVLELANEPAALPGGDRLIPQSEIRAAIEGDK